MVTSRKNVLDGLLTGSLAASTTIISDSIVQPALLLFRDLIDTKLERGESVCLVCCEIDGNRFVESLTPSSSAASAAAASGDDEKKKLSRLQVLDANLDSDSDDTTQAQAMYKTHSFDVDDVAGLSKLLQEVNDKEEHTTVFFDSINALETFNSTHAVLRMFRQCKQQTVAIHHTDVPTSPEGEEGSSSSLSKSQLLPSLLTASGSRSSIHLTLHPCSLLSHLHYIYGIENVGQSKPPYTNDPSSGSLADEDNEIDIRVHQFLELLHHRGWGSPLVNRAEQEETHDDEESYGGREYDSPSSSRVIMDLLGLSGKSSSHGSAAGRCVVEYALRGVNKSNKRSDASKIVRGLEGLKYETPTAKQQVAERTRLLSATNVSEVLRIKARGVKGSGQKDESKSSAADPWSSMTMFNLSLTDRQREEKERVELPFTRGGGEANGSGAIIIYEPDSADDLDESDPDEDLEI